MPQRLSVCDSSSCLGATRPAEKHRCHPVGADDTAEFSQDAVFKDQNQQNDLDAPEMRPNDVGQQFFIGGREAPRLLPVVALTSTRRKEESEQDYIARIIQDSKQQGRDAADLGTDIHTAIESFYEGRSHDKYQEHVQGCVRALEEQYGRIGWIAERSFGHEFGFAGKCDLHATNDPIGNGIVVDIKTKDFTDPKDVLAYDDHLMQLSAYRVGLGIPKARCANIFVSRTEAGLCKIIEWSEEDLTRGFEMFCSLLKFWQLKNKYK